MHLRRSVIPGILCLAVTCAPAPGADPEAAFDFLHNQIVLRTTVNGHGPYNFTLDSGTFASTIDLRLAKQLRLPLSRVRSEGTGAGSRRVFGQHTLCEELAVGDLTVRKLAMAALDLSHLSAQMGRPLHGVLGHGFLAGRITQVDYFHRRIRFLSQSPLDPDDLADSARLISFPMQFRKNSILPVLEDCLVNGTRIPLTLDTGSSLGLILFPNAVKYLGLTELARQGIPMEASGYRGRARLMKGWVRSLALKSIELGAIEAAYVQSGYGDDETIEQRGGNLGNAVLQDFVLTLDYRNRIVVLEATGE